MNLVIERQDRRVVITQRPPRPDLGIGEILIQGDSPIVLIPQDQERPDRRKRMDNK